MPEIINDKMLKRRLIYNAVPLEIAEQTCVIAGLGRSSPDVEAMERTASEDRLKKLIPILPILTALSDTLAEVATSVSIETLSENMDEVPEELKQSITLISSQNMRSTIISVLSVLVDLGFIQVAS